MHKENIQTLVGQIQKDYFNLGFDAKVDGVECDVCMAEYLAQFQIAEGITIEDAFEMYIHLMQWAEGDRFYRDIEGGAIYTDEMERLDF